VWVKYFSTGITQVVCHAGSGKGVPLPYNLLAGIEVYVFKKNKKFFKNPFTFSLPV
jgi:hypothetical protein